MCATITRGLRKSVLVFIVFAALVANIAKRFYDIRTPSGARVVAIIAAVVIGASIGIALRELSHAVPHASATDCPSLTGDGPASYL